MTKIYLAIHEHEFGVCNYLFLADEMPDNKKVIERFNIDLEPDIGEESLHIEEYDFSDLEHIDLDKKGLGDMAGMANAAQTLQSVNLARHIAGLKKWGEPDPENNGEPFDPINGLDDSHSCLMDLIDDARCVFPDCSPDIPNDEGELQSASP